MKILLGICGSVSAYKAYDLLRLLQKNGSEVKVVLTKGAEEFVTAKMFKYLGCKEVYQYHDDFSKSGPCVLHIELAKWADKLLLAPLSANTIANLASGKASDLLTSIFLALPQDRPIVAFPAMNTLMLKHPFVQQNLKKLEGLPQFFNHPTATGELACGDCGLGKLPEIETIASVVNAFSYVRNKKTVLISTGATISPIDPVRYLTNASSGITGHHLAIHALQKGYNVIVVAGKYATPKLEQLKEIPNFKLERVTTTKDMYTSIDKHFKKTDFYISSAAINDIEFPLNKTKLKKNQLADTLKIKSTIDILENMISKKKPTQKIIGFAAETELNIEAMNRKISSKPVDLLIGTKVHNGLNNSEGPELQAGFKDEGADYLIIDKNKKVLLDCHMEKKELASFIFGQASQW